jgi:hypothetical protein
MNKPTDFAAMFRTAFGEQGIPIPADAGRYTAWAKGNVEALLESSRILGEGLQKLGQAMMAEGKATIETLTQASSATSLADAATPADLLKIQGDLLRSQFETGLAFSSKQGEAMFKLTSEALAPIARRMSQAGELFKA